MEPWLIQLLGITVQTGVTLAIGFMAVGAMRTEIRYQGARLEKIEEKVEKLENLAVENARKDERISAMDQRLLAQGSRIDSTATILNGRMEAINNIVAGHTAQLNRINYSRAPRKTEEET